MDYMISYVPLNYWNNNIRVESTLFILYLVIVYHDGETKWDLNSSFYHPTTTYPMTVYSIIPWKLLSISNWTMLDWFIGKNISTVLLVEMVFGVIICDSNKWINVTYPSYWVWTISTIHLFPISLCRNRPLFFFPPSNIIVYIKDIYVLFRPVANVPPVKKVITDQTYIICFY